MQIALCDDLPEEREALREHINAFSMAKGLDYTIDEYENAETLLEDLANGKISPDLIFMDIYMDGISGMEAAKKIMADGFSCALIFTTTSESHSLESYKIMADGYLLKPYSREDFNRNFERIVEKYSQSYKTLSFPCDRLEFRVFQKDIEYIESNGRGSIIHTIVNAKKETLRTTKSVSEFADDLADEKNFYRCHQSNLINLNFADSVGEKTILMNSGAKVLFTIKNKAAVKKTVSDYFFLKMRED